MRSYVYLLEANEYCKIGITTQTIQSRIRELQTGCPFKITKLHSVDTKSVKHSMKVERWLHKKYGNYRLSGEWFNLSQNMKNDTIMLMNAFKEEYIFLDYMRIQREIYKVRNTKQANTIKKLEQQQFFLLTKYFYKK